VLDEAYAEFVTDPSVGDSVDLLGAHPNLVITRTFSKAHGLAALRIGYALGHPEVISTIDRTLVPFAVNSLAQRAALASLAASEEMEARVASVVAERERVTGALRAAGWTVPDPQGNFVWLPLAGAAAQLGTELERLGVVTRAFPEVGIRVTIADRQADDRFLTALAEASERTGIRPR
jgi:histidinol-phosphate aminotransferase